MSGHSNLPKPPHNPEVGKLVANLRAFHTPPDHEQAKQGFRGWHKRGYVPHYDVPNVIQFVTFRLADSLPAEVEARLANIADRDERRRRFESQLDRSYGLCHLRCPQIASLVEEALLFFHKQRYDLRAWCLMPNHVHVLFHVSEVSMSEIVDSWKSFTARKANRLLKQVGDTFWRPGYFDAYMRNALQEQHTTHYIEQNPCKAKRVRDPRAWQWSSARLMDDCGRLELPTGAGKPFGKKVEMHARQGGSSKFNE